MQRSFILICLFIALITGCKKQSSKDEAIFITKYAHTLSRDICIQNNIKGYTTLGGYQSLAEDAESTDSDTAMVVAYDRKGNLLSIELPNLGIMEYIYNDTLLVEERHYNNSGLYQTNKYTYKENIRIDSIYDSRHLYVWDIRHRDELKRDTAVYSFTEAKDWKQDMKESIGYDEYGLKKSEKRFANGYFITNERINDDKHLHSLIEQSGFDTDKNNIRTVKTEIEYNDKGEMIRNFTEGNSNEELDIKYESFYNEKGLPVKDIFYSDLYPHRIYVVKYSYQYFD